MFCRKEPCGARRNDDAEKEASDRDRRLSGNHREIIGESYYYVDKTLLVKELLDNRSKVFLITRPRRFGKTLGLSMLQTFFEDARDKNGNRIDNLHYFEGKKIMDAGEENAFPMQESILSLSCL